MKYKKEVLFFPKIGVAECFKYPDNNIYLICSMERKYGFFPVRKHAVKSDDFLFTIADNYKNGYWRNYRLKTELAPFPVTNLHKALYL